MTECKYEEVKLDSYLIPYVKINSKWINDLNLGAKTIQLLGKNTEEIFIGLAMDLVQVYIKFTNGFLDMTPKAEAMKNK